MLDFYAASALPSPIHGGAAVSSFQLLGAYSSTERISRSSSSDYHDQALCTRARPDKRTNGWKQWKHGVGRARSDSGNMGCDRRDYRACEQVVYSRFMSLPYSPWLIVGATQAEPNCREARKVRKSLRQEDLHLRTHASGLVNVTRGACDHRAQAKKGALQGNTDQRFGLVRSC